VPEVAETGEHHGEAGRVGGGDDLLVPQGSARLDDRRRAGIDGGLKAVGEGEEGVRGGDRAPPPSFTASFAVAASSAFQAAIREESTRLIWPAPTPSVAPWRA
jgi:hypothetical protein